MMAGTGPQAVGTPSPHILCTACSMRLIVIHKFGRWTVCIKCDTGFGGNVPVHPVGPPVLAKMYPHFGA